VLPPGPTRRPRLRPDLEVTEQTFQGRVYYVLKDPVTLRYFRLQREEYEILGLLDGTRDLGEVWTELSRRFPGLEADRDEVMRFVGQLAQANLLVVDSPERGPRLFEQRRRKRAARVKAVFNNILYVKIPVFDPDEIFTRLHRWLWFIWTRPFAILLLGLVTGAVWLVLSNWEEARRRSPEFFTLHNLPWLALAVVVVKSLHEFGHGLTCKHFGGEVHELGWLFLVFTPCFYCNVSDAWMIPHKRGKLLVTAAGVLTEFFFASIAVFLWWWTPPGALNSFAFNVAVVCSISTLAFNANPLLRYDGYYFLMDLLEIPNLRTRAYSYLRSLWYRYVLGARTPASAYSQQPVQYPRLFVIYAVASYCYRWMILLAIVYTVTHFLDRYGLGVISRMLGGMVILSMFVRPLWRGLVRMVKFRKEMGVRAARLAVVFGGAALVLVLVGLVPVDTTVRGSAVVEARDTQFVWVKTPGIVREVLVKEGDWVERGRVLARLENDRMSAEAAALSAEVARYRALALSLDAADDLPGRDRARILAEGRQAQLRQLRLDLDDLLLRAPVSGRVFGRDLDRLTGQFLPAGALFCRVGDDRRLEVRVLIEEDEYGRLFDSGRRVGQPARLFFFGQPGKVYHGTVRSVSVGDVPVIRYPALVAALGGEVAARVTRSGVPVPLKTQYEAVVSLEDASPGELVFGMTGRASIVCQRTRLYRRIYDSLADTIAPKIPR